MAPSVYGDVSTNEQVAGAGTTAEEARPAPVDPNDPALMSEQLEVDVNADAYAVPPPPPDGKWRAKLKQVDISDPATGQNAPARHIVFRHEKMNEGKPFYAINIEASLLDVTGKNDGVKANEYWVKSAIDRRKNIDQMTTITKAVQGNVVAKGSATDRLNAIEKALAGEPTCIIETFWEASCQSCQDAAKKRGDKAPKPFLVGQQRFPQPKVGTHDPVVQCPNCKSVCRAQVRIGGFFSEKDVKPTRGVA